MSQRQRRVSTEVSKILARLMVSEARDERFKHATITEVEISPDLGYTKVYVSVHHLSQDSNNFYEAEIIEALNKAAPWFQRGLGKELRLRKTPQVRFFIDSSAQKYAEINALLKKI
jgi:ribosome-binding factor A